MGPTQDDPNDTSLARALAKRGALDEETLRSCLDEVRAGRTLAPGLTLGLLILQRRLVSPEEIEAAAVEARAGLPKAPAPKEPTLGRYRIVRELARGGMGVVYEAEHVDTGQRYAVKQLLDLGMADPEEALRFQREAETLARLNHPNIVRIHTAELGPTPYLVQELMPGGSLQERLRSGPLPVEDAVTITRKLADALEHAHEQGLLHRDLKPHNILFDELGEPRLADFGLVLDLTRRSRRLTEEGAVLGTPAYMAPEQALGQVDMDRRVDVYGLGAVLYAALTGQPPFRGDGVFMLLNKVLHSDPEPPSKHTTQVPEWLDAVVLRALAKQPDDRFARASDFGAALEPAPTPVRSGTSPWVRLGTALVVLVALITLVGVLTRDGDPGVEPTEIASKTRTADATPTPAPKTPTTRAAPKLLVKIPGVHPARVQAILPWDDEHLLTAAGKHVYVWSTETGEELRSWRTPQLAPSRLVRVGSNLLLWDITRIEIRAFDGRLVRHLLPRHTVQCATIEGDLTAAAGARRISVWRKGRRLALLETEIEAHGLRFLPSGHLLHLGRDGTATAWNWRTGSVAWTQPTARRGTKHVALDLRPAGLLVGLRSTPGLSLWSLVGEKLERRVVIPRPIPVGLVALGPRGHRFVVATVRELAIGAVGGKARKIPWGGVQVLAVGKHAVYAAKDRRVVALSFAGRSVWSQPNGHIAGIIAVGFDPDGGVLSLDETGRVGAWADRQATFHAIHPPRRPYAGKGAFSRAGTLLYAPHRVGTAGRLFFGTPLGPAALKPTAPPRRLAVSEDGSLAILSYGRKRKTIVELQPLRPNAKAVELTTTPSAVTALAVSRDGKRALVGHKGLVRWIDLRLASETRQTQVDGIVLGVAFTPDHAYVAAERQLLKFDTTGQLQRKLPGLQLPTRALCTTRDGRRLAAGGHARVQLWDLETGKIRRTVNLHRPDRVTALAFDPAGRRLAIGTARGWVYVLDVD